jgi:hypothetical protein
MADKNKASQSNAWVHSFMLSRFLHFYDQFNDGDVDGAICIFENPFARAPAGSASEDQDTGDGPQADSAAAKDFSQGNQAGKKKQAATPV